MTLSFSQQAVIARPGAQLAMSALLTGAQSGGPAYVVLVGLDRDRYAEQADGNSGHLDGNGQHIAFTTLPFSDCSRIGIVFTLGPDGYTNSNYGRLDQLQYSPGGGEFRNALFTLYGFGADGKADPALLARLEAEVANPFFDGAAFMAPRNYPQAQHLGALDIVTRASYTDATPNAATPDEVAAVAKSLIGSAWNDNGCWVLANNIAAAAGASLPMTANETLPGQVPPVSNGPWFAAYNSALASEAQQRTWQSQLRPGDIVVANDSCGGHLATVVEGNGYAALFIDNNGVAVAGTAHDVLVGPPQPKGPWNFTDLANIVIYRLDTPVIDVKSGLCVSAGASALIAPLFAAADPAGKAIVSYQVYITGSGSVAGVAAHDPASALTLSAAAMASASFKAGASNEHIMLRAFNGSYWGDWESIDVAVGTSLRPAVLTTASNTLYLHGGSAVTLASLFAVDQGGAPVSSYTITQSPYGGRILLNGATDLLAGPKDDTAIRHYQVSAADFGKLTFMAGMYAGAETLSIVAHNGAALDSLPATIAVSPITPIVDGISRFVAPDAQVPLASLFALTLQDNTPVTHYLVNTEVVVTQWGDLVPAHGALQLNGARDLLAGSGSPAGSYQIPAEDLYKVTFHAGATAGVQFLQVAAFDGGVGLSGNLTLTTVAARAPLHAVPTQVANGASVSVQSLFAVDGGAAPAFYRFLDPKGGGALQLDSSATNLASKTFVTPGLIIVAASDLDKLAYIGDSALAGGSETITLSTSSDQLTWSAETALAVSTRARVLHAVAGTGTADKLAGSSADDAFDGGAGIDTVLLNAARSHFQVVHGASGWSTRDLTGALGNDVLLNVERLQFTDAALAIDTDGPAGSLYRLYQAAFDRKPDLGGLGWWLNQVDHGTSLMTVAGDFVISPEFTAKYGAHLGDAAFVAQLYANVLHRTGDTAGAAFWTTALGNGVSRESVLTQFADSPENVAQVIGAIQNGIEYLPVL